MSLSLYFASVNYKCICLRGREREQRMVVSWMPKAKHCVKAPRGQNESSRNLKAYPQYPPSCNPTLNEGYALEKKHDFFFLGTMRGFKTWIPRLYKGAIATGLCPCQQRMISIMRKVPEEILYTST